MRDEPRPIKRPTLARRKILADNHCARTRGLEKARRQRQPKAHRRRAIAWGRRDNLMQGVAGQAAAQPGIETRRQRQLCRRARLARPARGRNSRDRAAQMRQRLRLADRRHEFALGLCSLFVLVLDR